MSRARLDAPPVPPPLGDREAADKRHVAAGIAAAGSDAALVEQAAEGEVQAITAIWHRYHTFVRSVLVSTLGPDQEIDDLVQDVFINVFRAVKQTRDGNALPAILAKIATRQAGMTLRKRRVRSILTLLPWTKMPEVAVWPPDLDERTAVGALYRLLDRVRQRPRLAFLLHDVQGLDNQETAHALGVSLATAKRAVAEGRAAVLRLARLEPRLFHYLPRSHEEPKE